ncbi:ABC transporter permease [Desulfallas sp. Bu1-1]|uniref:ABC transporter permease n=1 Tax=Desulfallas sp. Bu1-1 TaxID=2787620 RepID=UPI00189DAF94|nr:ABC transporter permease [Desulfallas sp. Bu1-1]MBF7084020.1 ABC transporter permease [Desulfallas sp. Bu1-1]
MVRFMVRRLAMALVSLFFVVTLTFFIMKAIPGGPFASEKSLPPNILAAINEKYHLNDPLWKQYVDYLGRTARWDFGPSFKYPNRTVNDIIRDGFPVSAAVGAMAVGLALGVGLLAGVMSALKQNHFQDYGTMVLATLGFSVPSFVMAGLLQYFLAYRWQVLPPALWGSWKNIVMPALALSALPTAMIARLMRSSMLEVLQQDYIKTARAKGLSERVIIYRHVLRNAILPVVTYLGPLIAGVFTGSFIIESIFAVPGLGRWFVLSIANRDYTVIMGTTVFYSLFLIAMNLLVDLAYVIIDPRIKLVDRKE